MDSTVFATLAQVNSLQAYAAFLFGVFCAYWAQQTDRNPWLWFFGGLIAGPVAGLVLLYKNAEDRRNRPKS